MILLGTLKYLREKHKDAEDLANWISKDFLLARRANCFSPQHIPDLYILGAAGIHETFARVLICLWLNNNSMASWSDGSETDFYRELNMTTGQVAQIATVLRANGLIDHTLMPNDLSACRLTLQPAGQPRRFLASLAAYHRCLSSHLTEWRVRKQAEFQSLADETASLLVALVERRSLPEQHCLWGQETPAFPLGYVNGAFDLQFFGPVPLSRRSRFYANVPERGPMLATGLSDLEIDILLTAWESKGQISISRGTDSLTSQLHTSRERILRELEALLEVGWCRIVWDKRKVASRIDVNPPEMIFHGLSDSSQRIAEILEEYAETMPRAQSLAPNARMSTLVIPEDIGNKLTMAAKNARRGISFGFLIGECYDINCFEAKSVVEVPVKSDPQHHYSPIWADYHRIRKDLEQRGLLVIAEWHTHPDGDTGLHPQDLRKMKMLRRGYSMIISSDGICCYNWETQDGSLQCHDVQVIVR